MNPTKASSIDEFINKFPKTTQQLLQKIRKTIHTAAPEAQEKISYGIPTFTLHGNLVHFSAYEHHIGFYPGADGIRQFSDQLKNYETSKGTIRFPFDQPIPYALIAEITKFRVAQNLAKRS